MKKMRDTERSCAQEPHRALYGIMCTCVYVWCVCVCVCVCAPDQQVFTECNSPLSPLRPVPGQTRVNQQNSPLCLDGALALASLFLAAEVGMMAIREDGSHLQGSISGSCGGSALWDRKSEW